MLEITNPDIRTIQKSIELILDREYNRQLRHGQLDYVLRHLENTSSPYLYLKIAMEEIIRWKSSDHVYLQKAIKDRADKIKNELPKYLWD